MVRRDRDRHVRREKAARVRRRVSDEERAARKQHRRDAGTGERTESVGRRVGNVVGGARLQANGELGRADVVQLVSVERDREAGRARGLRERPHVVGFEHALLDERVDGLRQALGRDLRNSERRPLDERPPILGAMFWQRVEREVGRRDVDRRVGLGARDDPQLPQLLLGLEAVAALHLDGRCPEPRSCLKARA